ncbi:hypothetical protein QYF36_024271 [Acer negundo]|nr:hypothetical protein QYF36_024271 [Acer negundo]
MWPWNEHGTSTTRLRLPPCSSIYLQLFFFYLIELLHEEPVHIVYMGALPAGDSSPSSRHFSVLQEVVGAWGQRSFNGFAAKLTDQEQKVFQIISLATENEQSCYDWFAGMKLSVFPSKTFQLQSTSIDISGCAMDTVSSSKQHRPAVYWQCCSRGWDYIDGLCIYSSTLIDCLRLQYQIHRSF